MIIDSLNRLFSEYSKKIDEAYCNAEGPFTLAFKVKISPTSEGFNKVCSSINFVAEKVTDTIEFHVDESRKSEPVFNELEHTE